MANRPIIWCRTLPILGGGSGAQVIPGGHRRLLRMLDIYVCARATRELVKRVHQYSRCIDGLILPTPDKTTSQFKSKTELFIGPGHHDLMDGIYAIRSADEHLNETKYLEMFDREVRLDMLRKEMIVERIARTAIAKIFGTPDLWLHFANAMVLESFWKLDPADRQKLWGDPINPMVTIAGFDPAHIVDGELGKSNG